MTRSLSATRIAKAHSLGQFVAQREGVVTLDSNAYRDLHERGLNRGDVRQAIDDLAAEGTVTVEARLGRVRVIAAGVEL